ncbi:tetratricopeptide repeat protein, partial [Tepidibacillus infernus]|uniref:tetratricopeptide repeat protein n=1 Tax=Tepidibacillus infernus TaxID=1806172 RepID=UPI003B710A89
GTNYNIALSLAKLNKTNLAIPYANNALDVYLHENKWTNAAENYTLLGGLYIEERDFPNAEQNLQKALDLAENFNNEKLKGKIYHNLGIVYKNLKKLNKSMDYFVNYPPPTLRLEVGASKVIAPNGTKFT